jgi:ABC-type antimicrobial peptide transport system permease subunit
MSLLTIVGISVGIAAVVALTGLALGVSVALGRLGGLYPAWVGARMSPSTGLRHE